jgi:hypothetical protein
MGIMSGVAMIEDAFGNWQQGAALPPTPTRERFKEWWLEWKFDIQERKDPLVMA